METEEISERAEGKKSSHNRRKLGRNLNESKPVLPNYVHNELSIKLVGPDGSANCGLENLKEITHVSEDGKDDSALDRRRNDEYLRR